MPFLKQLSITQLRNLASLSLQPAEGVNILHGVNGSGKTSVLEGIHLLGMARSFRSKHLSPLIQHGEEVCTVYGELDEGTALGISKSRKQGQLIKIAGKPVESAAELAHRLPLQLMNSDTFKLLEGSPGVRRKFMDWGVFHVEHHFLQQWRHLQRALQHRNALLRRGAGRQELEPWSLEFIRQSTAVDAARASYLEKFLPVFREVLDELLALEDEITVEYRRGWKAGLALEEVLHESREREQSHGYTLFGPQKADLKIKLGKHDAADILSRGQQKLLVSALKISQGQLVLQARGKPCLYLIDDLPAELDAENRRKVCRLMEDMASQVFITCVEIEALAGCWPRRGESKLFHVKHGKISESA